VAAFRSFVFVEAGELVTRDSGHSSREGVLVVKRADVVVKCCGVECV
jgi:hypothetical protein